MPLITILFLSHSLIMHFTFVVSLNYFLTCVSSVDLCNSACRETKQPHLFGLFCVPSCALACRGTTRAPLTLSVLRMWMQKPLSSPNSRPFLSLLVICFPCARCFRTGQNCTFYQMDGSKVCTPGISCPLVVGVSNTIHVYYLLLSIKIVTLRFTVSRVLAENQ